MDSEDYVPASPTSKDLSGEMQRFRLESRYEVKKISDPEGKHDECRYFVLDPQHDINARGALRAYAINCSQTEPRLSKDLLEWINRLNAGKEV